MMRHYFSVARFFASKFESDYEDLVQATFLGLLEGFDRFRGDSSFRTYLFGIARNQLLTAIYRRTRDRTRFKPNESSIADLGLSPSRLLGAQDQRKLLVAALRTLPLNVQIMFELHYWEHMTTNEIAEVLEMNPSTVRTKMRRGRHKLEQELTRLAESDERLRSTLDSLSQWAQRLRKEVA